MVYFTKNVYTSVFVPSLKIRLFIGNVGWLQGRGDAENESIYGVDDDQHGLSVTSDLLIRGGVAILAFENFLQKEEIRIDDKSTEFGRPKPNFCVNHKSIVECDIIL